MKKLGQCVYRPIARGRLICLLALFTGVGAIASADSTSVDSYVRVAETIPADSVNFYVMAGKIIELYDCRIEGRLDLAEVVHSRIAFQACTFTDTADFSGVYFEDSVLFSECVFTKHATFDKANFNDLANFERAHFTSYTSFRWTRFGGRAYFRNCAFSDSSSFALSQFYDWAYFKHVRFQGSSDFSHTTFAGWTPFGDARFTARASFVFAAFLGSAGFGGVHFAQGADFGWSEMRGPVHFFRTSFEGSHWLPPVNLDNVMRPDLMASASFSNTTMDSVHFALTDVAGVCLEPRTISEYTMKHLADAVNLDELVYYYYSDKLSQLKRYFEDNGYPAQAKKVNCALRRHGANLFETIAFDLTSEYGSNRYRPLSIICLLAVLFALLYFTLILRLGKSGMYVITTSAPDETGNVIKAAKSINCASFGSGRYLWIIPERLLKIAGYAVFFSLINTVNIGFRDVNFGRLLRLLLPVKLDFESFGWMRSAAGLQSVLGVYLIALWALSYFSELFD